MASERKDWATALMCAAAATMAVLCVASRGAKSPEPTGTPSPTGSVTLAPSVAPTGATLTGVRGMYAPCGTEWQMPCVVIDAGYYLVSDYAPNGRDVIVRQVDVIATRHLDDGGTWYEVLS